MSAPGKTKILLAAIALATAGGGGLWAWRAHQQAEAQREQIRRTDEAWIALQSAEETRLATELKDGLNLARTRLAEIATDATRRLTLTVESSPSGARARVVSSTTPAEVLAEGDTPFSRDLPRGSYRLILELDGHETYERDLALQRSDLTVEAGLRPLTSSRDDRAGKNPPSSSGATSAVKVISRTPAVFPPALIRSGLSGTATVEVLIDANGQLADASVVQATHPDFGAAALKAVQSWRFEPARDGDRAVAASLQVPFTFALEPPPAAASTPDQFTNTLGMKFTRLAGSSVHVSVWLTREQDYDRFVRATGRGWDNPGHGADHPAVNVSWQDARAFCAWLTERERQAGRITARQTYRLPTDLEWSRAAGLADEPGATPRARDGQIADRFPWGTQWPPPAGSGNYGPSLGVDDYAGTSPVAAFKANALGYHDMGGNVWQWCADDYDPAAPGTKVLRGASFSRYARGYLLTSFRHQDRADTRDGYTGFRCVLETQP